MVASETPADLHERLGDDDVQVVDIRPARAFREGHVPGAINVPFAELPRRVEEVDWGDDIVVACPKGESSLQAARMLEAYEGVDEDARVANLEGGYREWDWALETGDGETPEGGSGERSGGGEGDGRDGGSGDGPEAPF